MLNKISINQLKELALNLKFDMEEKEDEQKIINLLEKELKKDRAKTQVVGFTPLHLLEMTRKHFCNN